MLGDFLMKNKLIKLAVAAVIFIVVLAGVQLITRTNQIALADVLAKVQEVRAFMYRMKVTTNGNIIPDMPAIRTEIDYIITVSNEFGMKWETETVIPNTGKSMTQKMYLLPEQKVEIVVMPEMKKYIQIEFSDDIFEKSKRQNNDPRVMIKQIMGCQYTELGRSIIDGREVEGYHTTDPAMLAGMGENIEFTFWIDVESWLPVRCEMDFDMGEQMQANSVVYDYQWDIPVDASDFEPVIPEDYTPISSESIKMPGVSEEAAIEGLKYFVGLSGRYPKKLDLMNLAMELAELGKNETLTNTDSKTNEESYEDGLARTIKEAMEIMRPVQAISIFYLSLVQDKKEPVYYGESVKPGDSSTVLLAWKISDNEYRVIFGDLMTEDVTAERLAELEEKLQN